jgi:hypothetical protein
MRALLIVKPQLPVAVPYSYAGATNLLTPDPKEAVMIIGPGAIVLDYGAPITLDTVFLGYHSGTADQLWSVQQIDANNNVTGPDLANTLAAPLGYGPPYHSFVRSAAPLTSRYWRLNFTTGASNTPWYAGVLCLGLAWSCQWGREWGSGRSIEDTGSVERLFGGGFGIDDGVAAGGFQWTFGDLQPEETRTLYQLAKERRTTRSVLVVEDSDQTDGLNERLHWGLFQKLQPYERLDPQNTKWGLQIGDWA